MEKWQEVSGEVTVKVSSNLPHIIGNIPFLTGVDIREFIEITMSSYRWILFEDLGNG
jgi:hypothetical protein